MTEPDPPLTNHTRFEFCTRRLFQGGAGPANNPRDDPDLLC
jgi:hypothetical protein